MTDLKEKLAHAIWMKKCHAGIPEGELNNFELNGREAEEQMRKDNLENMIHRGSVGR